MSSVVDGSNFFVFCDCRVQIENKKLEWKAESKVGSMDNARHKPGGGEKRVSCRLHVCENL